jgi:two-component system, cell cycle sensor histidine kinase and response regulator CckA
MNKKRLVIVEDERIIAEDIRSTLQNFGYEVIQIFARGEDAVEQVPKIEPDLILMDVMLEGELDGIQTATIIKEIYDVPIIYLTAYANDNTLNKAKITEPYGYIIKPFEDRELHATIEMAFYRFYLETRIKNDERKYRTLFNSIVEPVFIISKADKKFVDCNSTVEEIYGYSKEKLLTLTPNDLHIEGEEDFLSGNLNVSEFQNPIVYHHLTSNGELKYITAQTVSIMYEGESVWLSIIHDITASKLAEEKLQKTQLRLSTVFNNAPNIILYEIGSGRRFVSANIEKLIGITDEDFIDNPAIYKEMIHIDDRDLVAEKIRTWQESDDREMLTLWYRVQTKFNKTIWVEDRKVKIYPTKGESYITGILIDNTELKEVDAALKQSRSRYKAVVEDQTEFIYRFLENGDITFVNKAFCKYTKKFEQDLIGSKWMSEVPREIVSEIQMELKNLNPKQPVVNHEYSEINDDDLVWTDWNYRAIFNENNEFIEYQAVGKNITAKKKAEAEKEKIREQLYQSQKMEVVGKLAGGIAHDFNNLLTAINGYADLALKKLGPEDQTVNDIKVIKDCGLRAAKLTQQLLGFSRKQIIEMKNIDINVIISELEKMMDRLIGKDIILITELEDSNCIVQADSGQIEQVLINLIVNARDAMPNGGKIRTGCRHINKLPESITEPDDKTVDGYVEIYVKDSGTGMSEEIKNKIFEPFFTTKDVGKGTGLGLATVFGIVKQNNGIIHVESSIGEGSQFSVFLPAVQLNIDEVPVQETEEELPRGTETILLVEDEESIREFVTSILDEFGYKVIEASNGIQAFEIAEKGEKFIDLLLSDIRMPLMSGPELAVKVRNLYPDIKVLFVSGHTDNDIIRQDIADSKASFLQKPFSYEGLINKVRAVLDDKE